jgi:hypothetical protein
MGLQINRAARDSEGLGCAVLGYGVVAVGAAEASLDAGLLGIAVRCGSLSNPQWDQQKRYSDRQKCFLHGILLGILERYAVRNFT